MNFILNLNGNGEGTILRVRVVENFTPGKLIEIRRGKKQPI